MGRRISSSHRLNVETMHRRMRVRSIICATLCVVSQRRRPSLGIEFQGKNHLQKTALVCLQVPCVTQFFRRYLQCVAQAGIFIPRINSSRVLQPMYILIFHSNMRTRHTFYVLRQKKNFHAPVYMCMRGLVSLYFKYFAQLKSNRHPSCR